MPMTSAQSEAAAALLAWLAPIDEIGGEFDAVVGFGHFDFRIVDRCAAVFRSCAVKQIVFTGGIGAGTADLGQPEADAFLAYAARHHPGLPRERMTVENASTNTNENIRFTLALLARDHPGLRLKRVVLVANPSRQRRVMQTWRHLLPESAALASPPPTTFDEELKLFAARRHDLMAQMIGEVERLMAYPAKGWIAPLDVPQSVRIAAETIKGLELPKQ